MERLQRVPRGFPASEVTELKPFRPTLDAHSNMKIKQFISFFISLRQKRKKKLFFADRQPQRGAFAKALECRVATPHT